MARKTKEELLIQYHEMSAHENELHAQGYVYIAGIDEAGRGPLAGPVVAGAVILPPEERVVLPGVNDSKKLTHLQRARLLEEIKEKAVAWAVGIADVETIERINILEATKLAMKRAVEQLQIQPQILLIDALKLPELPYPQRGIIKGDALSVSIAAASIVAKETRDEMMARLDEIYPQYGFASNKGYGSAKHIEAIRAYGPTPVHRRTFIRHFTENAG